MLRNRINDYFVYTLHSALNDAKILRSLKIPVGLPVFSRRAYRPSGEQSRLTNVSHTVCTRAKTGDLTDAWPRAHSAAHSDDLPDLPS